MKIVIELSDKIYDTIMDDEMPTNEQIKVVVQRIYEGIPLPKGHGDLIDADELFLDIQTDEQMRLGEHLAWVKERIDEAPTVIGAEVGIDKES